jgi:hypothetical protein
MQQPSQVCPLPCLAHFRPEGTSAFHAGQGVGSWPVEAPETVTYAHAWVEF